MSQNMKALKWQLMQSKLSDVIPSIKMSWTFWGHRGPEISLWPRPPAPLRTAPSQVKSSNCFRRLEKLVAPYILTQSLSSFMMWNLQSYPATVLNEKKVIFYGVKTHSDPSYIISGGQDSLSHDICFCRKPFTHKIVKKHKIHTWNSVDSSVVGLNESKSAAYWDLWSYLLRF